MPITRQYTIACDAGGCGATDIVDAQHKEEAVDIWRDKGWLVGRGCVLCPTHRSGGGKGHVSKDTVEPADHP